MFVCFCCLYDRCNTRTRSVVFLCVVLVSNDLSKRCLQIVECEIGFYGQGCLELCACDSKINCDRFSGRCFCPDGLTGENCDQGKYLYQYRFIVLRPLDVCLLLIIFVVRAP